MNIIAAIHLFYKLAAIPSYPKCQVCGNADPYADPKDPFCYKHVGSNKKSPRESAPDKLKLVGFNLNHSRRATRVVFPFVIIARWGKNTASSPKIDEGDMSLYDAFDITIGVDEPGTRDIEYVRPQLDSRFRDKPWAKYFNSIVGMFVPTVIVNEIVDDLIVEVKNPQYNVP